jgi:uncharacterized repeat protein (TIGR03803 family)
MPLVICIAFACVAFQASAQFTAFHDFAADGLQPISGLTEIADGIFVGGAAGTYFATGNVYLYTLTRSGALTDTVTLPAPSCGPAELPIFITVGRPIQASDGNFYGAVNWLCDILSGGGYVYRLNSRGALVTLLKSFPWSIQNGAALIRSSLLEGLDGDLWGAESDGVFRLSKTGIYNVFSTGPFIPLGDFALGAGGPIYGSANHSGNASSMISSAIFQMPGPVLHGYLTGSTVGGPGPVIVGTDGLLYGATHVGGANNDCGTIFKLDPSNGAYSQLLDMPAAVCLSSLGFSPRPLVEAATLHSFYGVASDTASQKATVFWYSPRLPGGVRSFGPINDFVSELTQPVSGGIVGTAWGSTSRFAFAINGPAPEPLISAFSQNSGAPGTTIVIRGNYLLGTTVVNFNGVSASFHATSVNAVVATVPAGATTGPVTLGTPYGTAVSPMSFTVP